VTYTWNQKGAQSSELAIDFRSSPVQTRYRTVTGEDDQRDFELPKDVVVLDHNVVHHYQLLAARFRAGGGGKQSFSAFIPQEALPGALTVEDAGEEDIAINGRQVKLAHLVVTTELARIELWVDGRSQLQRMSVPAAQFEAVRK
jgi:hypothetical protein